MEKLPSFGPKVFQDISYIVFELAEMKKFMEKSNANSILLQTFEDLNINFWKKSWILRQKCFLENPSWKQFFIEKK